MYLIVLFLSHLNRLLLSEGFGELKLCDVDFNFTYVTDQKILRGKKYSHDLRWSNSHAFFRIVPWPQLETIYDPSRCLENDMCRHYHTKTHVFILLKHIFIVEKWYVTFVVFIKGKKRRRCRQANTFSRDLWFIHQRLYEDQFHYVYYIFSYNWKKKVEKIIKINDGLTKLCEPSKKWELCLFLSFEEFIGRLCYFNTFLSAA